MQLPLLSHGFYKPSPCSQMPTHQFPPRLYLWLKASTAAGILPVALPPIHPALRAKQLFYNRSNALCGFPPLILLKLPQLPHTRGLAFSPCCLCGIAQNSPFVIPAPPSQRKSIFPFQPTHVIRRIKRAIQIKFYLLYQIGCISLYPSLSPEAQ